ncbi:MAG: hypothetical protein JW959_09945 [Pirellulales bacterium]|nr:hypothetical protein [Pirellulales bacterium]
MKLQIEWSRPIALKDASRENGIYSADITKVPNDPGICIFGRRWGRQFEALYVGKATRIRGRVKGHFNNLHLMQHLKNAKNGNRIILTGKIITKPGQQLDKCLRLMERGFIRYFLSEGHDLVNKQGTRLRRHEVTSSGKHPKKFFPRLMYVEKSRGE